MGYRRRVLQRRSAQLITHRLLRCLTCPLAARATQTNDFGHNQDNGTAWEAGFVDTYTAFVANITGEYYKRPSLPVFLAIGPGRRSSTPRYQPLVEQVIANVNAAGGSATFLDLQSVNAAGGCDNHPSAAEEPAIAAAAQPQLAKVMGW